MTIFVSRVAQALGITVEEVAAELAQLRIINDAAGEPVRTSPDSAKALDAPGSNEVDGGWSAATEIYRVQPVIPSPAKTEAWMVPQIMSFKGVTRTNCPPEYQAEIEGTVVWEPTLIGDAPPVTDKFGVTHHPYALCRSLAQPEPDVDDGMCKSCVGDKCVTGPQCVTLGLDEPAAYQANILENAANWLDAKAQTVWQEGGYPDLMKSTAATLRGLKTSFLSSPAQPTAPPEVELDTISKLKHAEGYSPKDVAAAFDELVRDGKRFDAIVDGLLRKYNGETQSDSGLIAQQTREISELKAQVARHKDTDHKIHNILYCIGGPLNDNVLGYTLAQLSPFSDIAQLIED